MERTYFAGTYRLDWLLVKASLRDLLRGARNEVPPHQNRFGERRPTDQEQSSAASTAERNRGALRSKIVKLAFHKRLVGETAIAAEYEQRMFVARVER
jgi:hypothetical protein